MKKNPRLYQEIGTKLKTLIVTGNYTIGSRFMTEREIAEYFDISRTVVREALIMLELEGMISIKKGSGVYILTHPTTTQEDGDNLDYGPFEVLQARQVIESAITACAAIYVTKNDIIEMRQVLNAEKEAVLNHDNNAEDNDYKFHSLIAKASQNGMMVEILEQMWATRTNSPMWQQLHAHIEDKSFRQKWLVDHEYILTALQKKDPELARKAMWQHLENVKNTLMALSNIDDPNFDGYLFETIPYETLFESIKE